MSSLCQDFLIFQADFKSLSDNSNFCVILVVISVDCLFSFHVAICLVGGMMSDISLCARHFGYYVMRFWILLKSSVLVGFLWCSPGRGRVLPWCCHVGDSPVPHQPVANGGRHLMTAPHVVATSIMEGASSHLLQVKVPTSWFL